MLKKYPLLLLFSFAIFMVSCSKSEDVAPISLVGKWKFSRIYFDLDGKILNPTATIISEFDLSSTTWEFKTNNTMVAEDGSTQTYAFDADKKQVTITDETSHKIVFDVLLTGNTLKFTTPSIDLVKTFADSENIDTNSSEAGMLFLAAALLEDQEAILNEIGKGKKLKLGYEFVK
jgi:hypothetical protein